MAEEILSFFEDLQLKKLSLQSGCLVKVTFTVKTVKLVPKEVVALSLCTKSLGSRVICHCWRFYLLYSQCSGRVR